MRFDIFGFEVVSHTLVYRFLRRGISKPVTNRKHIVRVLEVEKRYCRKDQLQKSSLTKILYRVLYKVFTQHGLVFFQRRNKSIFSEREVLSETNILALHGVIIKECIIL